MPVALKILLSVVGAVLFCLFCWLFLIAPRRKKLAELAVPYAHRGLWNATLPENSLPAFQKAVEHGFGIELDVQLSADGEVMVFHDSTLSRVCRREGRLADFSAGELSAFSLSGSEETIPTLREVLALVKGRVPLLIELKGESGNTALCPAVAALLRDYHGAYSVESFNPLLLRWFKKHEKNTVRGLLVTDLQKAKRPGSRGVNFLLSHCLLNFLCRPAFFAYDKAYPHSIARRVGRLLGAGMFVYTVHDPAEYRRFLSNGICPIFDGFLPNGK